MPIRPCLTACLFLFSLMAAVFLATPAAAVKSVGDLKHVESQVKDLVEKVLPCTVCVRSARGQGSGSGVIVSEDGLVLTAAHVTAAAGKDLVIIFPDGRKLKAKAPGANRTRDAGMAQITEEGSYPFVDVGTSAGLDKNDWCISLGHAGGFDVKRTPPVRLGRVLAKERFVVTDCTIIGGDSGGPLFDLEGRLIGIHSNIGFSLSQNQHVPIDVFKDDWARMKKGETWGNLRGPGMDPQRPVLGVQLSQEPNDNGVGLDGVAPNSPAEKAGLRENDVIVKVDDKKVKSFADVIRLVQKKTPGEEVNLKIKRGDEMLDVAVKLVRAGELMPNGGQRPKNSETEDEDPADSETDQKVGKKEKKEHQKNEKENVDDSNNEDEKSAARTTEATENGDLEASDQDQTADADDAQEKQEQTSQKGEEEGPQQASGKSGRTIEELLNAARKNGGRLELTPDELKRLQQHMSERLRVRRSRPPVSTGPDEWYLQVMEAYKPVVAIAADSTYRVLVDGEQVALATAVSPNTLLTKASEIDAGAFEIELNNQRRVAGEVIETFARYDLALIRVNHKSLQPARLQAKDNDLPLGTFLASVSNKDEPAAIGLISVKARELNSGRGFLGILLENVDEAITIREVVPQSPAKKAGLKVDDVVTKLENKSYKELADFIKAVGSHKPGEEIELQVQRGDEQLIIKAKVGTPMAPPRSRIAMMNRMGSELSDTRAGFPLALQHDCPLRPIDCGGPLVNLDGDVIGINIARAGRIKSYAVPADVVQQLLNKAAENTQLDQTKDEAVVPAN